MKIKMLLSAIALTVLAASCGSDDNVTPQSKKNTGANAFQGIVFATRVTNPEGNNGSMYMQALADMTPGKYNNKNAIPTGFGSTPIITPSGNLYSFPDYMGNSKAEITRYNIDAQGNFVQKGTLSIPAGAAASNVVELNDEKAYVSFQGLGKIMVFNPQTMKKLTEIDLNSLAHKDTKVAPAAMIIRDGMLFVGLNQFNAQWMPTSNTIELAMIDTKTDQVKKHITNTSLGMSFATRPIDANSIFMDENKDIYINCIGAFGFMPQLPGGIARIKNGSEEIDPTYCIRFDQTEVKGLSVKKGEFAATTYYEGKGKLYAYLNAYGLDPNAMSNPYLSMTNVPVEIDLYQKSITKIEGMEVGNPQGTAIGKHKNLIVFGSANKKANGFYTYNPETKEVKGPVLEVMGNPSFFYSFAK